MPADGRRRKCQPEAASFAGTDSFRHPCSEVRGGRARDGANSHIQI
jgi:hypothetical protein